MEMCWLNWPINGVNKMSEDMYGDETDSDETDNEESYYDNEDDDDDEKECNERASCIEEIEDSIELALSPVLKRLPKKSKKCGRIDLPDSETALPDELERMVYRQEFEAVLNLPVPSRKKCIKPTIDDNGDVNWGAFGTVDFDKYRSFDKARYKAEKLKEVLSDTIIMAGIISSRIPIAARNKVKVLKYVKQGLIETDSIQNSDMRQLAKLFLRIIKLKKEISELQKRSRQRKRTAI